MSAQVLEALAKERVARRGACRKKALRVAPDALHRAMAAGLARHEAAIERGLPKLDAEARALHERVLAFARGVTAEALPRGLDAEVQAAAAELLGGLEAKPPLRDVCLALWVEVEGAAFALEALAVHASGHAAIDLPSDAARTTRRWSTDHGAREWVAWQMRDACAP